MVSAIVSVGSSHVVRGLRQWDQLLSCCSTGSCWAGCSPEGPPPDSGQGHLEHSGVHFLAVSWLERNKTLAISFTETNLSHQFGTGRCQQHKYSQQTRSSSWLHQPCSFLTHTQTPAVEPALQGKGYRCSRSDCSDTANWYHSSKWPQTLADTGPPVVSSGLYVSCYLLP